MARVEPGMTYRVGKGGVTITWGDGSCSTHSAGVKVYFAHMPRRIEGRLFRVSRTSAATYEAPTLEPENRASWYDPKTANYVYKNDDF